MSKTSPLPKIEQDAKTADLVGNAREDVEQNIEKIRTMVAEVLSRESDEFGEGTTALLTILLTNTERLRGISHAAVAEALGKTEPEDLPTVRAKIYNTLAIFKRNPNIDLAIESQLMYEKEGKRWRAFYFLTTKKEKQAETPRQRLELEEPMALPINEKKREALAKRIELAIRNTVMRGVVVRSFLETILEACRQGKSITIEYLIQEFERKHLGKKANQKVFLEAGYRIRQKLEKNPEEYGFTLINEGQNWQAILVETENDIEDKLDDLTEPPAKPSDLRTRVQDGVRHIASNKVLTAAMVSYVFEFILEKTLRGEWTTSKDIATSKGAKALGLTARYAYNILKKVRTLNKKNPKILGFTVETKGENYLRFCTTDQYTKAGVDYKTSAIGLYPVYLPGLTFDQHQFDRTAEIWIRSNKKEKQPIGKMLRTLASFSAKKQGISTQYAARITGLATTTEACQCMHGIRKLLNGKDWGMELVCDKELKIYYLKTEGAPKEEPATEAEIKAAVRLHMQAKAIGKTDGVDMKALATKLGTVGTRLNSWVSIEIARFVRPVAAELKAKGIEIDPQTLHGYLTEIYSNRILASRRVNEAKRHFTAGNKEKREIIFKFLAEKALTGESFLRNESAAEAHRVKQVIQRIGEINKEEPLLLGFQAVRVSGDSLIIEIRDEYEQTDLPYLKDTSTYPLEITSDEFHFDQNTFDETMLRWIVPAKGKSRAIITSKSTKYHILIALACFSKQGKAVTVYQLAKKTGINKKLIELALADFKRSIETHNENNGPLQLRKYKKRTIYLQTEKKETPPEKLEQHEDPVAPVTPASEIAFLRKAHARVLASPAPAQSNQQ